MAKFTKGKSGNPNGRPAGSKNKFRLPDLRDSIAVVLTKENDKGVTVLDALVSKLVKMALDGNMAAMRELLDRGWGKAKETVETIHSELPKVIYLPADTGVQPFLNESDVIDPTEPQQC